MTHEASTAHVEARDADGRPALLIFEGRAFVHGDMLDAAAKKARNSALEEAAKVADEWAEKFEGQTDFADFGPLMRNFAAAIREKIK